MRHLTGSFDNAGIPHPLMAPLIVQRYKGYGLNKSENGAYY